MDFDDYRKGWALRYLREAKDELKASRSSEASNELILDAVRKAQAAVYFSLGDPSYLENIVLEVSNSMKTVEDPVMRCLVEFERSLQRIDCLPISSNQEAYGRAAELLSIASKIVEVVTSEN